MAKYEEKQAWCPVCGCNVTARRRAPDHVLHLVISLLTGFWLIIWLYLAATEDKKPWICGTCQKPIVKGDIAEKKNAMQ